jgi:hypothetical protein
MIEQGIPAKSAAAASVDEIAALLQSFPRIGDFKAGQFALDFNYGPHLHLPVDNFVIAGPGAQKGVDRCFAAHGKRYDGMIRLVCQYQDDSSVAAVGEPVPRLHGRAPAPMTLQNWFCEISKYLRGESKYKYRVPAGTIKPLPEPVFRRLDLWTESRKAVRELNDRVLTTTIPIAGSTVIGGGSVLHKAPVVSPEPQSRQ